MIKNLLIFFFLIPLFSFCQNDTLKPGDEVHYSLPQKIKQDSIQKEIKFKHTNFVSCNFISALWGEVSIYAEHINKKGNGTEIGIGHIYPKDFGFFYFLSYKTGDYQLYGYSFYVSKKFYEVDRSPATYVSTEFILKYEYNNNMDVLVNGNQGIISHVSQTRYTPSLSFKIGHRSKSGVTDLYFGAGFSYRYAETIYKNNNTYTSPDFLKLRYDNGWNPFFLFRAGLKIGFPLN